jgi:hypothetical protein
MDSSEPQREHLTGGMMNAPLRIGHTVHRTRTKATETIQRLLRHVRATGIDWVSEPFGIVKGHEVVSYLEGTVPHDMPPWIWSESILRDVAKHQRSWHDATLGFDLTDAIWSLDSRTPHEVVCHNDFAPYNCVFEAKRLVGLIDFDLCSPGSRLWDMAYTAYRFVPVMPASRHEPHDDLSPFDSAEVMRRVDLFLDAYAAEGAFHRPHRDDLLRTMVDRLASISEWTRDHAERTANPVLARNSQMYARHSRWILTELLVSEERPTLHTRTPS